MAVAQGDPIFISYADADRTFAEHLCALLEQRGERCWIAPRDIAPGAKYGAAILAAIQSSVAMIVVLSPAANASRFVPREVERAASLGLRLLVVRSEDVQPGDDLALFLSERQWIDGHRLDAKALSQRLAQGLADAPSRGLAPREQPHSPRRRLRLMVMAGCLIAAAIAAIGFLFTPSSLRPAPAATPREFAERFFAAQDSDDDTAVRALFSERSRGLLNVEQWRAYVASARVQTASAAKERRYLAELRWNVRATNYLSSVGGAAVLTQRRLGAADVLCEVLNLQANGDSWEAEGYMYWPSIEGPCLDEAALQAAGRRAVALVSKIRDDALDSEDDVAAALRPLTQDAGWSHSLTSLRANLATADGEILAVLPSGLFAYGPGLTIRGRFATVRLSNDRPPLRQNLDLTLQLDADGAWRMVSLPLLHPLPL